MKLDKGVIGLGVGVTGIMVGIGCLAILPFPINLVAQVCATIIGCVLQYIIGEKL